MRISVNLNDYQKANEKKKKDEETGEDKNELVKKLDKIQKDYESQEYYTYGGEKIKKYKPETYEGKTDEQIKTEAEKAYKPSYESEKKQAETDFEEKKAEADKAYEQSERKAAEKAEKALNDYAAEAENAKNVAVKRGLSRSSIIGGLIDEIEKNKAEYQKSEEAAEADRKEAAETEKDELEEAFLNDLEKIRSRKENNVSKYVKTATKEREKEAEAVKKRNESNESKQKKVFEKLGFEDGVLDETLTDEYVSAYAEKFKTLLDYYKSQENKAKKLADDKAFVESYIGKDGYEYLKKFVK